MAPVLPLFPPKPPLSLKSPVLLMSIPLPPPMMRAHALSHDSPTPALTADQGNGSFSSASHASLCWATIRCALASSCRAPSFCRGHQWSDLLLLFYASFVPCSAISFS